MKPALILALLAVSLVVNGLMVKRRWDGPRAASGASPGPAVRGGIPPAARTTDAPAGEPRFPSDPRALAAELRAAGLPPEMIRAWVTAAIDEQFKAREQALVSPPKTRAWQPDPIVPLATKLARIELQLEKNRLRDELLGFDPALPENAAYAWLPPENRQRIKQIMDEYTAKIDAHRTTAGTMATPEEQAAIARLERERKEALAGFLDDAQQLELELRIAITTPPQPESSLLGPTPAAARPLAQRLQRTLRHFDSTEEEFALLYQAERDTQVSLANGVPTPEQLRLRAEALRNWEQRLRAELGDARFAEYETARWQDYSAASDLALRTGLPQARVKEVFALYDQAAAESNRIGNDPTLDVEQKLEAMRTLAQDTRQKAGALYGPTVAPIARHPSWLDLIERGRMVTLLKNQNGFSTRPVVPPAR